MVFISRYACYLARSWSAPTPIRTIILQQLPGWNNVTVMLTSPALLALCERGQRHSAWHISLVYLEAPRRARYQCDASACSFLALEKALAKFGEIRLLNETCPIAGSSRSDNRNRYIRRRELPVTGHRILLDTSTLCHLF